MKTLIERSLPYLNMFQQKDPTLDNHLFQIHHLHLHCLYISILKLIVLLLLLYEIQDQILMKTYKNNTVCLTRVIIYRKRSPIFLLESIENSPRL